MTVIGKRKREAVSSSDRTMASPPSPVTAITGLAGCSSLAASAAGTAWPMVERPWETR